MKLFSFEKLNVWQKSQELSKTIYNLTKSFPNDERFGLTSQMRRSAISVSSNIAEGTGRHTNRDKARFTEIAYGSVSRIAKPSYFIKRYGISIGHRLRNHKNLH